MAASEPTFQLSKKKETFFALSQSFRALTVRWVVPLSPTQLNRAYLLPASLFCRDSELDSGTKPKPLLPQSVTLPSTITPPKLNFGLFLWEPASARFD